MAKRITEILIDDIDGTEIIGGNGETMQFSLDGVAYEIDLKADHAQALRSALAPYTEVARKAQPGAKATKRGASARVSRDLGQARSWLRAQGHTVSDRGRIPGDLLAQYDAAHEG